MQKIITVFGSALIKHSDPHYKQAEHIGRMLAQNNYTICSGGYGGIMEAVSRGAKSVDGNTIGITLDIPGREPNEYIDENVIMPNWVERLMELIALGDSYVIFKGGSGTLVELSAAIEMMNKKVMKDKLLIFYRRFWEKTIGTIKDDSRSLTKLINQRIVFINSPKILIETLSKNKV
jgi:hypothetical protein